MVAGGSRRKELLSCCRRCRAVARPAWSTCTRSRCACPCSEIERPHHHSLAALRSFRCGSDIQPARRASILPRVVASTRCERYEGGSQADVWLSVLAEAARREILAQSVRCTRSKHASKPYLLILTLSLPGRRGGGFYACSTSEYRLHYLETASGLRFVLTTDLAATDMREALRHIYAQIYVECLTKNPLYATNEPISCPLFTQTLDRFMSSLAS